MSKKVIGIILSVLLIFIVMLLMFMPKLETPKELNINKAKKDVLNEIQFNKDYQKKVSKWATNSEDNEYESPSVQNDPKLDVVKYFITGITTNDVNIFLSSFYAQTISEDLFKIKNPDKTAVAQEMIKRLSKNGTLEDVKYIDEKGALGSSTNRITLTLIYKDKKQAKVTLSTMLLGDKHHEDNKVSLITTSVWDIIKQIERES